MGKLFLLLIVALGVALAVPKTRAQIVTPTKTWAYRKLVPNRIEMIAAQLDFVRKRGGPAPLERRSHAVDGEHHDRAGARSVGERILHGRARRPLPVGTGGGRRRAGEPRRCA